MSPLFDLLNVAGVKRNVLGKGVGGNGATQAAVGFFCSGSGTINQLQITSHLHILMFVDTRVASNKSR